MIENDEQLQVSYEALGDLYQVLASYRAKILAKNRRNYEVIAQGPLEEIRKIQGEIDDYLGLKEFVGVEETDSALQETPLPCRQPADSK